MNNHRDFAASRLRVNRISREAAKGAKQE